MKSNTQNTKIEAVTENTLVVGIDVGSEFHYARAFDWRGIEFSKKPFKFSNTEPGFEEFKKYRGQTPPWSNDNQLKLIILKSDEKV